MIGWKRIVVTVGEKIGKTHLTYGQGAAAELVAMGTIAAADSFGLPVSTTHVLSSGVAGTMAANGSGVQMSTIRNSAIGLGADPALRDRAVGDAVLSVPPARTPDLEQDEESGSTSPPASRSKLLESISFMILDRSVRKSS